jgi:hypothetical protein
MLFTVLSSLFSKVGFLPHYWLKLCISSQWRWIVGLIDFLVEWLLPVTKGKKEVTRNVPTEKSRDFCLITVNSMEDGGRNPESKSSISKTYMVKKFFKGTVPPI